MLSKVEAERILDQALATSKAEQTEALILAHDVALTRFAQNVIHQNVSERDAILRLRAVVDNRIGVASGNNLSREGILALAERAVAIARLQPPDPDFPGLPRPQRYPQVKAFYESTATCSPDRRARLAGDVCLRAARMGLQAAGALETGVHVVAVANSNGLLAYHTYTAAEFSTVVMSEDSSGYGFALAGDLNQLALDEASQRAVGKAVRSHKPRPLTPGSYTVVLEPDATADILGSMGYTAFSATAVEDGSSFLRDRFGQQVLASSVTILDNGLNPATLPMPFDYEGVAKEPVQIIENGVAKAVVHDSYSAAKAGAHSTGHALPAPNPNGPFPGHLVLVPGSASLEELIAGVKRGLLVTRFHYTRTVHPLSVTVTGMTRDGTFFIENGEIAYPVRNLRFTQSYVEALGQPVTISREQRLCGEYGPYLAPAISIPEFRFTGVTEF